MTRLETSCQRRTVSETRRKRNRATRYPVPKRGDVFDVLEKAAEKRKPSKRDRKRTGR